VGAKFRELGDDQLAAEGLRHRPANPIPRPKNGGEQCDRRPVRKTCYPLVIG
jgi:hypothetical protein